MSTQIILNPIGSSGDVFPFLALGQELQRRKHHVAIMTNPLFKTNVGQAGLEFIDLGTETELRSVGESPGIHDHRSAWKLALRWGAVGTMRQTVSYLRERRKRCPTLLVSTPLGFGSRIAADAFDIPLATVVLSPYMLRSVHRSPVIKPMWLGASVPRLAKSAQYWVADRFFIDPVVKDEVNQLQRELGLPRTRRFLHRWCFSNDVCIGAFPESFAPKQPDWPDQLHLTGNFVWDSPIDPMIERKMDSFLTENPNPIVVTAGSAGADSPEFYQIWTDAAKAIGKSTIILEKDPNALPLELPSHVLRVQYYPMDQLLPNVSAVVHSGGVGVSLRCLAAAVPQIVIPRVNDQLDNANRIVSQKMGVSISPKLVNQETAGICLQTVLAAEFPAMRPQRKHGSTGDTANSVAVACDWIESIFTDDPNSRIDVSGTASGN